MRHVFIATRMGYGISEGIWFDSNLYTKEEAIAQFEPIQDFNANGYPYTRYIYDGIDYRNFEYLGEYEDDKMPTNNREYVDYLLSKLPPDSDDEDGFQG